MRRNPAGAGLRISPEIADALREGRPVVALESSVLAQGLPIPANRDACERMVRAIADNGAIAAITAIVRGEPVIGLGGSDLERFLERDGVAKVAARDLGSACARGQDGATTVSASIVLAALAGIETFATGGIGGVHREAPFDESADLIELSRVPIVCVCAGAKAVLDLRATAERLETLSVPIVGFGTDWLPEFYSEGAAIPVTCRADSPEDVARIFQRHVALGLPGAVLVGNPPPRESGLDRDEVERAVRAALDQLRRTGTEGKAVTPTLLAAVERATGGRSVATNVALLESNAALGARIAVELSQRSGEASYDVTDGGS